MRRASAIPRLFDADANLTHKALCAAAGAEIAWAARAGVSRLLVPGSDIPSSRAAAALADAHPRVVYATAGVHPYSVGTCGDGSVDAIRSLLSHRGVVAVGECGEGATLTTTMSCVALVLEFSFSPYRSA